MPPSFQRSCAMFNSFAFHQQLDEARPISLTQFLIKEHLLPLPPSAPQGKILSIMDYSIF